MSGSGERIGLVVALSPNVLLQLLVILLVAVLTFGLFADLLHEFFLHEAHRFDSFVSRLEGVEEVLFRHLVHLTFHHHDILVSSADHQIHIGFLQLLESRVDHELAVDTSHTHLRDRSVEWDVGNSQRSRSRETRQRIRLVHTIRGNHIHRHESLRMVVIREQRSEGTVDQTCRQNLIIGGFSLPLRKTAWESSVRAELLFVLHRQRHEIRSRYCFFRRTHCRQHHSVAHFHYDSAVRLLRQLTRLDTDRTAVRQSDRLSNYIHLFSFSSKNILNIPQI